MKGVAKMILPGPVRTILAVLRGSVSPVFIFVSIMLGFWFGLTPSWSGLHTVLVILSLVLNTQFGLFLLSAGIGKAVSFAAAPMLYHIGVWIHNCLPWLPCILASIPVLGITDFNRYSVSGALVAGPIVGGIAGLFIARAVIMFRRMLLKLEEGSEKFKKWYSNRGVRILDRLLVSRRTKDIKSLFTDKARVFRKAGVALAVLLLAGSVIAAALLKDSKVRDYLATAMTRANRAEVDLDTFSVSILTGEVSVSGIQVTDPENPANNHFSADKVAADASLYNLLLGRLVIDQVEISDVKFDQKRTTPGKIVEPDIEQTPGIFDPCEFKLHPVDVTKLDKYVKDAKALKEKLQKLRRWLPKPQDGKAAGQPKEVPQKYLDYLQARAAVPALPRIVAKKAILDKVQIQSPIFGNSKILLTNISDAPAAAKLPVTLELISNDTPASVSITIDYSSKDPVPRLSGKFSGFDLAKIQSGIGDNAGLVFQSGVASGQFSGVATSDSVDLTIDIAIRDLQAKGSGKGILGLGSEQTSEVFDGLKELKTKVRVVGPVNEPYLAFDLKSLTDEFKQALVSAGKEKLFKEIDDRIGKQLDQKLGDKIPNELKNALKKPKELIDSLGGLLEGKRQNKDKQ